MEFLRQPYPYFHSGKQLVRNTLLILTLAFLFEFLIEPFNVNRSEHNFAYWVIVLLHSSNGALIYLVLFSLVGIWANKEDWRVYHEVIWLAIMLLLIGSGSYFLREVIYDNPNNQTIGYYIEEVRNTFLVGSILLFIIVVINYNFHLKKNIATASQLNNANVPKSSEGQPVEIKAALASDHFELLPSEVLCIRSDGNYLEFFVKKDDEIQKLLKRLTLQSASEQLASFPFIVKTHRAFLVNILHLEKVTGNAAGYQLQLRNLDFMVPVSRAHISDFNAMAR